MRILSSPFLPTLLAAAVASGTATSQQATRPHWSTYFGGTNLEHGQAICRGPGNLITIAGTTMSSGLATTGAYQTTYAGNGDGFVARFDPSRPPGQQLLWCTYFGGSGLEIVFDVTVDAAGNTTFAGFTTTPGPQVSGPSDAFIARLDAAGGSLLNLVYIGGVDHDHISDLEALDNGAIAFIGITRANIPGALNSFQGGPNDAFLGVIDWTAASPLQWVRHVGGWGGEGWAVAFYLSQGGLTSLWPGNLRRQAVTELPGGRLAACTFSDGGGSTMAGVYPAVYQAPSLGSGDIYYVELSSSGNLEHATYIGGSDFDWPTDLDYSPEGGVVITGITWSPDLPTTQGALQTTFAGNPSDAFVLHFDPSLPTGQVRYGTYVGGDAGEDILTRVLVESSGLVTLAGAGSGGGMARFPTTQGALRTTAAPSQLCGAIVRMRLDSRGRGDLAYSTLLGQGGTVIGGLVLDEVGDAFVVAGTTDLNYPLQSPQQPTLGGQSDAAITHLPLLAGGTERQQLAAARSACAGLLHSAALCEPFAGKPHHTLCATNAPPGGIGVLAFGVPTPPTPWLNVDVLVNPIVVIFATADALGYASHPLPVPANFPAGFQTWTQWAFLTTPSCPGSGPVATTERLQITTL